jgi:tetratricopeptide (TPR) repeat protein
MYDSRATMTCLCLVLIAAPAFGQSDVAEAATQSEAIPSAHYIEGVPFVGWGEAADFGYPHNDILNPSYTAASQMVWRYWGVPLDPDTGWPAEDLPDGGYETVKDATLDDLKYQLANDRLVEIFPAITAHAHYLYITVKLMAKFSEEADYDLEQTGPTSGMLAEMVSIDAFMNAVSKGCPKKMINDSVFIAGRVVVGYDDARQVVIIHDPIFGPDWEVSYEDFQSMWRFAFNSMVVVRLDGIGFERHPAGPERMVRNADHDAAFALFNGYSLAAVNRLDDAERELRRGVAIEGTSMRYQHLFRVELGSLLADTGRLDEAVEVLRKAVDVYPHHFRAWGELGNAYRDIGGRESRRSAQKAYARMEKLCSDKAQGRVAQELGKDFFVLGCKAGKLGWWKP